MRRLTRVTTRPVQFSCNDVLSELDVPISFEADEFVMSSRQHIPSVIPEVGWGATGKSIGRGTRKL